MAQKKGRGRALITVLIALALVCGIAAHRTGYWPFDKKDTPASGDTAGTKAVDEKGGTFIFDSGVTITVPAGAVTDRSTLSVGDVTQRSAGVASPLAGVNRGALAFDVSLSQGKKRDVQPLKPLGITISLSGTMLPAGAPSQALLYTGVGTGYQLVPHTLHGVVLTAHLTHLSPKYITYVDEKKFATAFGIDGQSITRPADCKSQVTASKTGKVMLGSGNKGWSNTDKDSPIYACLTAGSDGNPRVGIVNKRYYVLSTAVSSGVSIQTSPGDTDEELTKLFVRTVFPNKKIAGYLGRDGRLVATTPSNSLPARIQLRADAGTFLAESGLFALTYVAGILTGKDSSELTKTVKALLDIKDVTACLRQSLDISTGNAFDFGFDDAIDLVTSKCMQTIGEALGVPSNPWDLFGKWFQTVGSGLSGGWKTIRTAYEGIRLQTPDGSPPVTVRVEKEAPPLTLDGFTGDWWVHSGDMTVKADGTGIATWNAGPCEDNLSSAGMCTGHSTLKAVPVSKNSFRVTRTSVWYTNAAGERHIPYTVRKYGNDRKVGDTTVFTRVSSTAIKTPSGSGDGFGNPYMCRLQGPEAGTDLCGA